MTLINTELRVGYTLLFVSLVSNVMAIVLQALCARLAIASGRDLAQACRDAYRRWAAYPPIRLAPWLRRLATRAIAIVPAAGVTILYGEQQTGKVSILSQVILSLQLPFAVVPLVQFTAERTKMGALRAPIWLSAFAGLIAVTIIALNAKLIWDQLIG